MPLLDLTISNPTQVLTDYPHASISHAFAGVQGFTYCPNPFGIHEARTAVAKYYRSRAVAVSPEWLLLTASTSEAYALLFKLLCNPGDEILIPLPSYPLFEYLAQLESVRAIPYRLLYDGSWYPDFEDLQQRFSSRTRAVIIVNPNNPTGSFIKPAEADALFELSARWNVPIISDEVFMDYELRGLADRVQTLIPQSPVLSFSLNGLSKSAGMPQMKLAWIAINGPDGQRQEARDRLELISDSYLSVATPVQRALPELLRIGEEIQRKLISRIKHNLFVIRQILSGSPANMLHVEGGWSAIVQLPRTLAEETWTTRLLEEKQVVVQPGYFFDMNAEAYVVISLITPEDDLAEGIERLRQLVYES